jgi:hypothetical protein
MWTFLEKIEPPRPEIDVKWDSTTHVGKTFCVFTAVLSANGFKVANSANKSKTKFWPNI